MRSPAQIEAARLNGAKSRGPITPEGRKKSSLNSLQSGLFAQALVLTTESREDFDQLQSSYLAKFQPTDSVEIDLVNEMVAAKWRQARAWNLESANIELELFHQQDRLEKNFSHLDESTRLAIAYDSLCNHRKTLVQIARAEAAYTRQFDRALKNLLKLRETNLASLDILIEVPLEPALQNEPEPPTCVPPGPEMMALQNEPEPAASAPAVQPLSPEQPAHHVLKEVA